MVTQDEKTLVSEFLAYLDQEGRKNKQRDLIEAFLAGDKKTVKAFEDEMEKWGEHKPFDDMEELIKCSARHWRNSHAKRLFDKRN